MNGFEKFIRESVEMNAVKYKQILQDELNKKEAPTMQVTYNGFTGELVKLERKEAVMTFNQLECRGAAKATVYNLSLYDSEKQATISFTGVKLEDMKFLGGEVSFR